MKALLFATTAAGLLALASPAAAQVYASVHGGYNIIHDFEADVNGLTADFDNESTPHAGGSIGYKFGKDQGLRLELEALYMFSTDFALQSVNNVKAPAGLLEVDAEAVRGFVNVAYDFPLMQGVTSYVIAGLGYSYYMTSVGDAGAPAGQIGVGFDYKLTDHTSLGIAYKFGATYGLDIGGADIDWLTDSRIEAGMKFSF